MNLFVTSAKWLVRYILPLFIMLSCSKPVISLEEQFLNPPTSVKPYVWWHWMGSNFSKEGITKDLEAMKAEGIGGATIFNLASAVQESHAPTLNNPWPEQTYRSQAYWEAIRFAASEAQRLGLEIGLHNTVGYSTTGGPWIDEERSMQHLVWSDTIISGGAELNLKLTVPKLIADEGWGKTGRKISFYKDIVVLAVPAEKKEIATAEVLNLTSQYDAESGLKWSVPSGKWIIYRIGHASTGRPPHPVPDDVLGKVLEADKMSVEQSAFHWKSVLDPIKEHLGEYMGKSFKHMLIDSYEAGNQNWTPGFREEFIKRKGYDPIPWLATFSQTVGTGKDSRDRRIIGNEDQTARFDWDYQDVIDHLFYENGWNIGKKMLKDAKLDLQFEPYGGPFNTPQGVALADLPMAEFWTAGIGGIYSAVPAAARAAGKTVVGAEAFTGRPEVSQFTEDPAFLKPSADKVFAQGINRMILHHWVHQPFDERYQPGMGMGWWGTHFGRNQTWFEPGKAFFTYLARCQALLQYGEQPADYLCVGKAEGFSDLISMSDFLKGNIRVERGKIVLPSGRTYSFMVFLGENVMLPEVALKIKQIVSDGATIVSAKPTKSPSMKDYPKCDEELMQLASEVWGNNTSNNYKKGFVFTRLEDAIRESGITPDFQVEKATNPNDIRIAHRRSADTDIYFVSNQSDKAQFITVSFRISGKQPELWQAENGNISTAPVWSDNNGRTTVSLSLKGIQSVFVVFRKAASKADHTVSVMAKDTDTNWSIQSDKNGLPVLFASETVSLEVVYASGKQKTIEAKPLAPVEVSGSWKVTFTPKTDQKFELDFPELTDFSNHSNKSVKYFSGTATYRKKINIDSASLKERTILDLGEMNDIAEVRVNGKSAGVLWYPPYRADITELLIAGENEMEILVTTNWANRLIGDEKEPADFEWGKDRGEKMGRAMLAYPEWFVKNQPRSSQGRKTFSIWYYYRTDSELKAAGLTGPVSLVHVSPKSFSQSKTSYTVDNYSIVGQNTGRYNNRPLYINNTNAFILTGDQPIARLAKSQFMYGTFMAGIERKGKAKWLQNCSRITSFYKPGIMKWEVTDNDFPGLKITIEIVPMASGTGMAVSSVAEGVQQGDSLIWSFGGARWFEKQNLSWKMDVMGQPELLTWGFVPGDCSDNQIKIDGRNYLVSLMDSTNQKSYFSVAGKCSESGLAMVGDASNWNDTKKFNTSKANNLSILNGKIPLTNEKTVYWAFNAYNANEPVDLKKTENPQNIFAEGQKRTDSFKNRLKINTPDAYLNAIARASVAAVDGTWYPPVFVHGGMQWNSRFPGWRTIFGGTMYGWHDRVMAEAKFYTDFQIKKSDKKEAKADPSTLLTEQHPDSRFYGVGRIDKDQKFYDMQSQFFDQIIEEYRWTADPELIKFFREALELHLLWMKECFDPDGDGIYESYINSWPSDSQWYNGGGSAEETSYAYRGHSAAKDMAHNFGDAESEKYHTQMLEKIRRGFFDKLWIQEKGHSGSYREQGGHNRLHKDPWLYSIFLPVDAGLTSPLQSVESVYYSEWALQNDRMPYGGRQVWSSNWLPGIWSVRELWPGDNYHLALSYFKAGLPDDGYDIFRGTFLRTAFNHISPGNLGGMQGGVDFGDCVHTFTRTLVTGLFGYQPDYPNGKVRIAPQFPTGWDNASIELPDFGIAFKRTAGNYTWSVKLKRAASVELYLPVQTDEVKSVTVNGKSVEWELIASIGRSVCKIILANNDKAEVVVKTGKDLNYYPPVLIEGTHDGVISISAKDAQIESVEDPQQVLANEKNQKDVFTGNLSGEKGFHTVFAHTNTGKAPQIRVFRIKVNDPDGDAKEASRLVDKIPVNATFENIIISTLFNADVTTIYRQKYLSPRQNTVSVRLGTDGYSPWTFWHWKSLPPEIRTDNVNKMLDRQDRLITPQGVSFNWSQDEKNIAFTSIWDNFPSEIEFPVNKKGDAVWFLVSGSTNVMQCQIANAVIRLNYADGKTDSLELVPPINYWNLSTIDSHATAPGQGSRTDYTSETDRFCLPAKLPETVQLGENCRAMLLNLKMRPGVELKSVSLETLSQEVVVGLMGITIMDQK